MISRFSPLSLKLLVTGAGRVPTPLCTDSRYRTLYHSLLAHLSIFGYLPSRIYLSEEWSQILLSTPGSREYDPGCCFGFSNIYRISSILQPHNHFREVFSWRAPATAHMPWSARQDATYGGVTASRRGSIYPKSN